MVSIGGLFTEGGDIGVLVGIVNRGVKKHLKHILTATAMNMICLLAWFQGVPDAQTRVSSFAQLAPD